MSDAKKSKVKFVSVLLLTLASAVGTVALISKDVVAQSSAMTLTPTGSAVIKLGGMGVRLNRFEDSDTKAVCYITEIGGISCVKK